MSDEKEEITRRLVRVAFDPYFMKQLFTQGKEVHLKCVEGLPENAEWIGEYFDQQTCRVFFIFRHESFEPIPPYLMLPELRIVAEHCPTQRAADVCQECGETETIDPNNDGVPVCVFCGTRR